MPRTDLTVPYAEKDEAKKLGARWDAKQKIWYVPEGKDIEPLKKWLPNIPPLPDLPQTIEFTPNKDGELAARIDDLEITCKNGVYCLRVWSTQTYIPCDYLETGCPEGPERYQHTCPKVNECPYEFSEHSPNDLHFVWGTAGENIEAIIRDMLKNGHDDMGHRRRWPQPAATIFAMVPWHFTLQ